MGSVGSLTSHSLSTSRGPCQVLHAQRVHHAHLRTAHRCSLAHRSVKCEAAGVEKELSQKVYPIPRDANEQIEQASNAAQRAWGAGVKRQRLELLLPLIGATDLDDWPGGVRQQFKAIRPMAEGILLALKKLPGLEGSLKSQILDQGDAVGLWQSPALGAIVFPTAETLSEARTAAEKKSGKGLMLMFNPQWQTGQIISDFGIGPWRKRSEDFVDSFEQTYFLKQFRILGDEVKLLRCYPSEWQIHVNDAAGVPEFVVMLPQKPAYKELEAILKGRAGSNAAKGWADRLRSELQFNQKSMQE